MFWFSFKFLGHSFHCFQNYIFKCLIYHFHNFIFQCLVRSCIVVLILWPVSCLLYHCYSSTFFKLLWPLYITFNASFISIAIFCFSCKTFIPCCCMHVICKNSHMSTKCVCQGGSKTCDPKSSSILAELAGFPTTLVAFLYGLRVWKYTCTISISSDVTTFVFETVIGYVWDKIFK